MRVFDVEDGRLLRTIRLPAGPGNVGKAFAVAIGPDGELIAAGGWTRGVAGQEQDLPLRPRERRAGPPHRRPAERSSSTSPSRPTAASSRRRWARAACASSTASGAGPRSRAIRPTAIASYGVAFAPGAAARLATTSYDGRIRLYPPLAELVAGGHIAPAAEVAAPAGSRPFGLAFRPDGAVLAVGYDDTTAVSLLDARTLAPSTRPTPPGSTGGDLSRVAWSADGAVLFAGGRYISRQRRKPVIAWADGGAGARRSLPASANTIMSLVPLAAGDLLTHPQTPTSPASPATAARPAGATARPRPTCATSARPSPSAPTAASSTSASSPWVRPPPASTSPPSR